MAPRPFVYWGDQLPKKAPDTNDLTIETEQVERGMVFKVSAANIVDKTTANKLLEIGIKRGSDYHPYVKRGPSNITGEYSLPQNVCGIVLKEREQLYGKVYSPTTGDECVLVFSGELGLRE